MRSTTIHLPPAAQRWLRNSPITPYVLIYLDYLTKCRYADETTEHYLAGFVHLGLWMGLNHLRIGEFDETVVTQFLVAKLKLPAAYFSYPFRSQSGLWSFFTPFT